MVHESEDKECDEESYMWATALLLEKYIQSINLKNTEWTFPLYLLCELFIQVGLHTLQRKT